jgi:integrase
MAALQTGCRYAELCRLRVDDFNRDSGTIAVRKSKSGKPRHVVLSDEGCAFFSEITVGRRGDEIMLRYEIRLDLALEKERERLLGEGKDPAKARITGDAGEWRTAAPAPWMKVACERAGIEPITFHGLRHSWASLAIMNGTPLNIVARNLGHSDTRMVEKFYGHLADSYITDAIRKGAPTFGFKASGKVVATAAE